MNKLEILLDNLIEGTILYKDEYALSFANDSLKIQFIFTKDNNSEICFLDCVKDYAYEEKNKKFEFDLPLIHIHNFISKHLGDDKSHHLLQYNKAKSNNTVEDVYKKLADKANKNIQFSKYFMPVIIKNELVNELIISKNHNTKKHKL